MEGESQSVAVEEILFPEILYLLFLSQSVGMDWIRQGQSTHTHFSRRRERWYFPEGLRPTHPFQKGVSIIRTRPKKQQQKKRESHAKDTTPTPAPPADEEDDIAKRD